MSFQDILDKKEGKTSQINATKKTGTSNNSRLQALIKRKEERDKKLKTNETSGESIEKNNIKQPTTLESEEKSTWRKVLDSTGVATQTDYIEPEKNGFEKFLDVITASPTSMSGYKSNLENAGAIFSNLYQGAETGVLDASKYSGKIQDKVYEIYDNLNPVAKTAGTVLLPQVGVGRLSKKIGDNLGENIPLLNSEEGYKFIDEQKAINQKKIEENVEKTTNPVAKKIAELTPSIGNTVVGTGVSALNPIAGTAYFMSSAGGSYYDEGLSRGMSEDEALGYGTIMGTLEGVTERYLAGQNIKGFKAILEGTGLKNAVKAFGIEVGENFIQEAVMTPLSELSAKGVAGDKALNYDFTTAEGWKKLGSDSIQAGIDGALSAILLGGITKGVASAVNVTNKLKNGQVPTQQEIKQGILDSQEAGVDVKTELAQSLQQQILKRQNNTQNLQQNTAKNQNNIQQQQISQVANKMSLNQNVEHQNNYFTSAQKYNINTNTQSVRKIWELANKRGINITYDDSLFKNNSNANAIYQTTTDKDGNVTRNIILNPNMNTNRTLEQIELHEIVHDMYGTEQFNKLKEMVLNYDKSKSGYQEARVELEQLYSQIYDKNSADFQSLIDEEAVADILGNRLGDQEFVNSIVNMKESRSIARKIYDWVVEKLNNMTRSFENMNQYFYWKDVKNKFEEAFRQEYKGIAKLTKFSINSNFAQEYDNWDKVNRNGNFLIGRTSEALKSIGLNDYDIVIDKSKIIDILNKHPEMNDEFIKQIPDILENPTLILKSQTVKGRIIVFSEIKATDNKPILVAMELNPSENKNNVEKIYKVASAYGRQNVKKMQDWLNKQDNILYIDKQKNRTINWLNGLGLRLPVPYNSNSSTNSVAQNNQNVNNDTTVKYSMQESENNSGSFNLPKTDNQGRMLTKEQQEYFKDSKVRDKNGNLMIMYHGTNNDFTVFDKSLSDEDNVLGQGLYFTADSEQSLKYGEKQYEVYLNIKNPLIIEDLTTQALANKINSIDNNADIMDYDYGVASTEKMTNYLIKNGYDGIKAGDNVYVAFESNQVKRVNNTNPTDNPDIRYSTNSTNAWQQRLDTLYKNNNKGTKLQDIKLPTKENMQQNINLPPPKNKTLNPTEIANLKQEDANTTVKLPQKESKQGNKVSSFFKNVTRDAQFLEKDLRKQISTDQDVIYYEGITNEQTLNQAFKELQDGGSSATLEWFNQDSKKATAKDTVKGWILLKQYQDAGDYQSAVQVAKKMREIGTTAGQTVQAFNILSRLTPEGMVYYAQSELSEAYEAMVKNKSKDWIDKNASNFDLTPQETQFIMDTMEEVGKMEDGYDKKVKLAEIQKIITDKIPPTKGQSIKAWMRISMLFNPKTQVRNVMGNATILPVNMFSDLMSTAVDKAIAKKTGTRTTGMTNIAKYGKGFGKGLYESYNDFRKGINTRNIQGNRFEVTEGRNFKNKGLGKALNKVDNMLSFMLDAGDRGFYEATFTNSINNQLILNKTTEVTQDMIDIATNEALQRTWQDNNEYTKAVLQIRKILNKFGTKSYGLGDILIPFAKTPANLTKAIVDYSPVGLVKTITKDAIIFNRSLSNGQYSAQLQHKLVQNLGKGMAGTALYVLGYALAKAGIASGESDDDKDVKNFMKNSLGISSYSIKIGDRSFTFDWAQPVATPLAIMTNYVKYSEDNPDAKAIEKALQSINIGTEQLLQQSFMESLNTVMNGNGTFMENLSQAVLDLPARAIPTFSKQIADMVDGTQRTTFEYNKPVQSAVNAVKAKIPGLSKTLPASTDTLGNEIQKYGGENNLFNVFFNPANVNKGELSKAGEEIYELYKETGNTSLFPRTAPYYMNSDGEKINMTAETRADFQKVSGKYVENSIEKLLDNKTYKNLSDSEKAEIIEEIISDSYNKAKYEVLDIENETYSKKRQLIEKVGVADYYDYIIKTSDIEGSGAEKKKIKVLAESDYSNKHKEAIYEAKMGSDDELYSIVMKNTGINITEYLNYKSQEFTSDKKDDGTVDGKSISGSKKQKVYAYVNNMKITGNQRLLLLGTQYKLTNSERQAVAQYVKSLKITKKEKLEIYDKLQGFTVYKDGRVTF